MKEVLEDFGIVFIGLLAIFAGVCIVTAMGNWLDNKAEAKPVITEIPEYTMKCTVFENTCKEFTIYRITRN